MAKETRSSIENQFAGLGENMAISPEFKETKVLFAPNSGLFKVYTQQLYMNLSMTQGAVVPDKADLDDYLSILLKFRVEYAKGERLPFPPKDTVFCVPAFFSQILTCVGRVVSEEYGLILTPEFTRTWKVKSRMPIPSDAGELKDTSEVERIKQLDELFVDATSYSRKFRPFFEAANIVYATELPKSRDGNLSFMALQVVDSLVKAESSRAHPVYALMTAILNSKMAEQVLMPRVSYGSLNYLTTQVLRIGDYERSK